ncbi:hypothetical protein CASFOL_021948 [Castilleja foliolosa]|uniref:F-box domain-containing protein n=1 Tax=Castilleja foliolosa TaxID=1961234 RepID=A0ABD3D0R9_9LAMI
MNKQSVKRRREKDDDGSAITTDRLSQLPQPILHQILSLLSQKDAVRTSVLSKSWRYLWHGRLNVEFRDGDYRFIRENEFWSFVDKTLQRYLDQNLSLQKILVDIYNNEVDFELLQKWIPIVIMNMCVRWFNLISRRSYIVFPLPLVVFQSESLVELHLQECDLSILKSTNNVMLKNLQTLRLHDVDITDEIFDKIISSCPLIENLDLLYCSGLESLKLHKHHKIKSFACSGDDDQIIIEIEEPQTLESVHIQNCQDWFLRHKNMHFSHLKSLNLFMVKVPAETLDNFSSFFPCVNELILNKCDGVKDFLLLSSSIKRLTIIMDMRNRMKAFIDTPNILYFEYSGHGFLPSIEFATTSNEWNSQITVVYKLRHSHNDATFWFLELNKLLKALSQSHITLILNPNEYNKLHINDSYGSFYKPVVVEHLKFWESFSSSSSAILNCFFRVCRPCYLHMIGGRAKCSFAEYISKLIPDETVAGCFWLQELEQVSTEVWKKEAKEWRCVKGTSLRALRSQQEIRFRLTWKNQ